MTLWTVAHQVALSMGFPRQEYWGGLPCSPPRDLPTKGSIPWLGRFLGGGHSNPHQYSCLKNPMDRATWWATLHRVAKSWTKLKRPSTQKFTKTGRVGIRNIKTLGKFNQDNLSFWETRLFSTQIQWKRNTGNTSVTWKCSTIFI